MIRQRSKVFNHMRLIEIIHNLGNIGQAFERPFNRMFFHRSFKTHDLSEVSRSSAQMLRKLFVNSRPRRLIFRGDFSDRAIDSVIIFEFFDNPVQKRMSESFKFGKPVIFCARYFMLDTF